MYRPDRPTARRRRGQRDAGARGGGDAGAAAFKALPLAPIRPTYARMFRFIARFLGLWIVAAALVAAIVDGAKSLAASALVLTPLSETWATAAAWAGWTESAEELAAFILWPFDVLYVWMLAAPTVLVLAVVGVLLLVLGSRRRRPSMGREFAT